MKRTLRWWGLGVVVLLVACILLAPHVADSRRALPPPVAVRHHAPPPPAAACTVYRDIGTALRTPIATVHVPRPPLQIVTAERLGLAYASGIDSARLKYPLLSIIDSKSGRLLRVVHTQLPVSSIAVDEVHRHLFVVEDTSASSGAYAQVAMLNPQTGALLATTRLAPLDMDDVGVPALIDAKASRLYILRSGSPFDATQPSMLVLLDTRTGRLVRTVPVAAGSLAVDPATNRLFALGDRLHMLDATTGGVLRTVAVGRNPGSMVVDVSTGHLFVATQTALVMLDARSGRILRQAAGQSGTLGLAMQGHRLFNVHTGNGDSQARVDVYDTRTGSRVAASPLLHYTARAGVVSFDVTLEQAKLVVIYAQGQPGLHGLHALGPDRLAVVDAGSGKLLRTLALDQTSGIPSMIYAVDGQRGRAFLANANGSVRVSNIACVRSS